MLNSPHRFRRKDQKLGWDVAIRVLSGEFASIQKAKEYCGKPLNIRKGADPDITILNQAGVEYAKLQWSPTPSPKLVGPCPE